MTSSLVIFLQGWHLTNRDRKNWQDELKVERFLPHCKSNSWGVVTVFRETKLLELIIRSKTRW